MKVKKSKVLDKLFEKAQKPSHRDNKAWCFSWFTHIQARFPSLSNTEVRTLEEVFDLAYDERK